jgi:flagellar capping protein FliD
VNNIGGSDEYEKKIEELTQQISAHKSQLDEKQKMFEQVTSVSDACLQEMEPYFFVACLAGCGWRQN